MPAKLRTGTAHRMISLAALRPAIPTDLETGRAARKALYRTGRWQRARLRFLAAHPLCAACKAKGLVVAATVVDHRDGHRTSSWRARFWDETRWQPLCIDCHAAKSAAELAEWNRAAGTAAPDKGG